MTDKGNWLARTWHQRGLAACLLWPLSLLYGQISGLQRRLYQTGIFKTERCSVPVIVVGNVVAGGAGKTPLVIALTKHLQQQGLQVGVVSRGYGRQGKSCLEVFENTPVSQSGDEPALIKRATGAPVFIAKKRIDAARALLTAHPHTQLLVCDDGLQHYALARDVEVAVFDDRGVGQSGGTLAGTTSADYTADAQAALAAGKLGEYQTDVEAVGKLLEQARALASPGTATTTTTMARTTTTTSAGSNPQALARATAG